jgi:hypothetical protein
MHKHPGQLVIAMSPILLILLVFCAACGGSAASPGNARPTPPATAYIEGTVTAGPRCPVARAERPCPPKAVPGAQVQLLDGTHVMVDGHTDQLGRFRLQAPAGQFVVRATNVGAYRSTASQPVRLTPGTTTTVSLQLDTGIR